MVAGSTGNLGANARGPGKEGVGDHTLKYLRQLQVMKYIYRESKIGVFLSTDH